MLCFTIPREFYLIPLSLERFHVVLFRIELFEKKYQLFFNISFIKASILTSKLALELFIIFSL